MRMKLKTIEEVQTLVDSDSRFSGKTKVISIGQDGDSFRVLFSNGRSWTLYVSCLVNNVTN